MKLVSVHSEPSTREENASGTNGHEIRQNAKFLHTWHGAFLCHRHRSEVRVRADCENRKSKKSAPTLEDAKVNGCNASVLVWNIENTSTPAMRGRETLHFGSTSGIYIILRQGAKQTQPPYSCLVSGRKDRCCDDRALVLKFLSLSQEFGTQILEDRY